MPAYFYRHAFEKLQLPRFEEVAADQVALFCSAPTAVLTTRNPASTTYRPCMIPFVKNAQLGRWEVAIKIQLVEDMEIYVDEKAEHISCYIPTRDPVVKAIAEAMSLMPF